MYFPHRNGVNGVQVPKVNPEGLFNPIIPQNLYSLGELNHLEKQCFLWDENEFRKKKKVNSEISLGEQKIITPTAIKLRTSLP